MYGKSGENPPLPRNCNRRELSVVATEVVTGESQETDQIPIFLGYSGFDGRVGRRLVFFCAATCQLTFLSRFFELAETSVPIVEPD